MIAGVFLNLYDSWIFFAILALYYIFYLKSLFEDSSKRMKRIFNKWYIERVYDKKACPYLDRCVIDFFLVKDFREHLIEDNFEGLSQDKVEMQMCHCLSGMFEYCSFYQNYEGIKVIVDLEEEKKKVKKKEKKEESSHRDRDFLYWNWRQLRFPNAPM